MSVDAFDRVVAAVDASHYLLTPSAVATPQNVNEVAELFAYASTHGEAITFRSGGTSLSGQASTSNILVDTRKHFRSISIEDEGKLARVSPGATVRQVNARLLRHGRKLGPDPASEIACTIGGVVANNSSGMACGTEHNTYNTLHSIVIVLPSGTVVDTSAPDADERLRKSEPALWDALTNLRHELVSRPDLSAEILRQYQIKNTMGYGLNSFLDYETPAEILAHLMVGSEGTLGFVAEARFNTVPLLSHAATALLVFSTLREATDSLEAIIATQPATVELMDAASLRAALLDEESREALPTFTIVDHCALLVEYRAETAPELFELSVEAQNLFEQLPLVTSPTLSHDAQVRESLWHIRKGLYATVAEARPSGTTALLEDIAVPVEKLSETCAGLIRLFKSYGYDEAVIFGHAKDGNIHFLVTEDFEVDANVERYRSFTEDMVDLVLSAGGTLKAEHGTGRIMAPFVEKQYGPELYRVMKEIKKAFDPAGILNRDTILTDDADLHLLHLKSTPTVEAEVDRCVECGYCEPVCPSKDLTTTPRQRIAVRRAIADAELRGNSSLANELRKKQDYEVINTCAVDGMCQTACPVRINTGDLVRKLRAETAKPANSAVWNAASKAWGPVTNVASAALTMAKVIPSGMITLPNKAARSLVGNDTVPMWSSDLPKGGAQRKSGTTGTSIQAVYFQACVGTMFGPAEGGEGVAAAFQSLAAKAGIGLIRPTNVENLCCGTPWKSKGILNGYKEMVSKTVASLWAASNSGELPIICDNSSCSEGLVLSIEKAIESDARYHSLKIVDAVDFAAEHILPAIEISQTVESIVVHPTCSSTRAGSNSNLTRLASAVATNVTIPDDWGCCAFAGDRGMLHPELTSSATSRESANVNAATFDAYVSCNRTCEIGMTRATGHPYQHVLETLDQKSTPKNQTSARKDKDV